MNLNYCTGYTVAVKIWQYSTESCILSVCNIKSAGLFSGCQISCASNHAKACSIRIEFLNYCCCFVHEVRSHTETTVHYWVFLFPCSESSATWTSTHCTHWAQSSGCASSYKSGTASSSTSAPKMNNFFVAWLTIGSLAAHDDRNLVLQSWQGACIMLTQVCHEKFPAIFSPNALVRILFIPSFT